HARFPVTMSPMVPARLMLSLGGVALCAIGLAADRRMQVTWGQGQHVTAVISYPAGTGPAPTLFIASGRSGGMNAPIIKGLSDKGVRDGLIAVRFDYAYFVVKGGKPSQGLVDEADQFNAVIAEAMKDPRVDPRRIIISGKSLGSVVAHRVFK